MDLQYHDVPEKRMKSASDHVVRVKRGKQFLLWAIVLGGLVVTVLPGLWMVLASFKTRAEIQAIPLQFFPETLHLDNYVKAIELTQFPRALLASLLTTSLITVLHVIASTWGGYVFGKLRWPGRDKVFVLLLTTMMIPEFLTLVPRYVLVSRLGLINNYAAVMIPFVVAAFGIFLARQFIMAIPNELIDAATVDGCSSLGIYRHVILPNSRPVMAILAIMIFNSAWDDLLWSSLVLTRRELWTLPIAIANLRVQAQNLYELQMAASTLAVIPVVLLFVLLQRQIIKSVALSGIK